MGCHTWVYKDVDALTDDEYDEFIVDRYKSDHMNTYDGYKKKGDAYFRELADMAMKHRESYGYAYGDMTPDEIVEHERIRCENEVKTYEWLSSKRRTGKELKKNGAHRVFLTKHVGGKMYIDINDGDLFRVDNYPTFVATSYGSLKRWLYRNKNRYNFHYYAENGGGFVFKLDKKILGEIKHLFSKHGNKIVIDFG